MAGLDGFNAADVEPNEGFDVLPAGEYRVCIVGSSRKATKKGDGQIIELELQVLDGQYQNRKVWERINFINPNPTAQQIGRGTLSAICRAVGVLQPGDTADLHSRPMLVKLKITKQEGYGDKNEVVKYSPTSVSPQQPQRQAQPATAGAWAQTVG